MSYSNFYFVAKALHLVGAFSWMAGVFYLVRIMVYHAESNEKTGAEKEILSKQYAIMERKAYNVILKPAVVITWTFGSILLALQPAWTYQPWFLGKFVLLLALTGYTYYCSLHIKWLESGEFRYAHLYYRKMNEVPTIFMVGIIFLAVFKNGINWLYLSLGIAGFALLIFYAVQRANRVKS